MRCTSPRTVGFYDDGKTLCWSPKKYSKQYPVFQIPCGKCLSCRLETARQTAIRCVHEAQMHENNSFITLTYSDENLKSEKLQYEDFQLFIKRLRSKIWRESGKQKEIYETKKISVFSVGEYGEKNKRPHWHALIFNWRPSDLRPAYTNDRGDQAFWSDELDVLWGQGRTEIGSVTLESAGYCARYSSKKLVHGKDNEHDYNPISKRSSKHAIGKKWIERFWSDVFTHGYIILPNGVQSSIPRYYEKWFKKNHPDAWSHYVTVTKQKVIDDAIIKEEKITTEEKKINFARSARLGLEFKRQRSRNESKKKILEQKFKQLQQHLKL